MLIVTRGAHEDNVSVGTKPLSQGPHAGLKLTDDCTYVAVDGAGAVRPVRVAVSIGGHGVDSKPIFRISLSNEPQSTD